MEQNSQCGYFRWTSLIICVCIQGLAVWRTAQTDNVTSISSLSDHCRKPGQLLQITEAFFCNQTEQSPSDTNDKTTGRRDFEPSVLNQIYEILGSNTNNQTMKNDLKDLVPGAHEIHFVCVGGDQQNPVDPCGEYQDGGLFRENVTSIFINPGGSDSKSCQTHCILELEILPFIRLESIFHRGSSTMSTPYADNMEYRYLPHLENTSYTNWTSLSGSSIYEGENLAITTRVDLRFQLSDLSTITRIWLILSELWKPKGIPFNISCTPIAGPATETTDSQEEPTESTKNTTNVEVILLPGTKTTISEAEPAESGENTAKVAVIIPTVVIAAIIVITGAVILIRQRKCPWQRKRDDPEIHQNLAHFTSHPDPTHSTTTTTTITPTATTIAVAYNDDADEYSRLALNYVEPARPREEGHDDFYDHTTPAMVTSNSNDKKEEEEDTYNLLHQQIPERQLVVENTYDRAVAVAGSRAVVSDFDRNVATGTVGWESGGDAIAGCHDEDEYSRLALPSKNNSQSLCSLRQEERIASDDVYDHASSMATEVDAYQVCQVYPKKEEVIDNIYDRTVH